MKQLLFVACVASVACLATGARAQPSGQPTEQTFMVPTTSALVELCSDTSQSNTLMTAAAQNFCHGYLLGAYQILVEIDAAQRKPTFCIPNPPPTRNQAVAAFVAWAKGNPQAANLPPADGVYTFLVQRFPCAAR